MKKARVTKAAKIRRMWKIKPVEKIVESKKLYRRERQKREFLKEHDRK
jgi:hypothetical protein